jgi:hypothetical protein
MSQILASILPAWRSFLHPRTVMTFILCASAGPGVLSASGSDRPGGVPSRDNH